MSKVSNCGGGVVFAYEVREILAQEGRHWQVLARWEVIHPRPIPSGLIEQELKDSVLPNLIECIGDVSGDNRARVRCMGGFLARLPPKKQKRKRKRVRCGCVGGTVEPLIECTKGTKKMVSCPAAFSYEVSPPRNHAFQLTGSRSCQFGREWRYKPQS